MTFEILVRGGSCATVSQWWDGCLGTRIELSEFQLLRDDLATGTVHVVEDGVFSAPHITAHTSQVGHVRTSVRGVWLDAPAAMLETRQAALLDTLEELRQRHAAEPIPCFDLVARPWEEDLAFVRSPPTHEELRDAREKWLQAELQDAPSWMTKGLHTELAEIRAGTWVPDAPLVTFRTHATDRVSVVLAIALALSLAHATQAMLIDPHSGVSYAPGELPQAAASLLRSGLETE
ncbi:MAG: hypothetical protein AAGE52_08180 [Myxococcota bacterium]